MEDKAEPKTRLKPCDFRRRVVHRQTVIINVYEIKEVSDEFCHEDFCLGVLSTIFHELRHLVYECNEILEIGSEKYPEDGYLEDNVEDYGNAYAEKVYRKYRNMFLNMRCKIFYN